MTKVIVNWYNSNSIVKLLVRFDFLQNYTQDFFNQYFNYYTELKMYQYKLLLNYFYTNKANNENYN